MKFIAHRGACLEYQEDTLASLMRGAEYGAFAVECDLRYLKDGTIILFHDIDLNRIANDPHKLSELTYAEAKQILENAGKELTTLDEVLENYRGSSAVLFDMPHGATDEGLYKKLKNAPFDSIVGVHAINEAKIAGKYFDKKDILAFMPKPEMANEFAQAGAGNIRLWEYWLESYPISEVRKTIPDDREIWIMTADFSNPDRTFHLMDGTKDEIEKFISFGADGMLLNDISLSLLYK